jgi:hypothetical protein
VASSQPETQFLCLVHFIVDFFFRKATETSFLEIKKMFHREKTSKMQKMAGLTKTRSFCPKKGWA